MIRSFQFLHFWLYLSVQFPISLNQFNNCWKSISFFYNWTIFERPCLIAILYPISGLFWGRRLQPLLPSSSDQFGEDNLISLDPSRAGSCDEKWFFNVERKVASRKKLCQQKVENQWTIGGKIRSRLLSNGKLGSWIHILKCFMNISFYQSWEKT